MSTPITASLRFDRKTSDHASPGPRGTSKNIFYELSQVLSPAHQAPTTGTPGPAPAAAGAGVAAAAAGTATGVAATVTGFAVLGPAMGVVPLVAPATPAAPESPATPATDSELRQKGW